MNNQLTPKHFTLVIRFVLMLFITTPFNSYSLQASNAQWVLMDQLNSNIPNERINDITQDTNGDIWIATNYGFAKYLGNFQWQVFHHPQATTWDVCLEIVAQDSIIWVATVNGLIRYCNGQIVVYDPGNSALGAFYIYSLAVEGNILWVGTGDYGVYKFDGTQFINYSYHNTGNMPLGNIWSIAIDQSGKKWFACRDARQPNLLGAIVTFDNSIWSLYDTSNSNVQIHPNKITIDSDDKKWTTSHYQNLVSYDNTSWVVCDSSIAGRKTCGYSETAFDVGNNKWFATIGGVCKYDGITWTFFDSTNVPFPMPINATWSVFVDSYNNKWVGTSKGILIYNENYVHLISTEDFMSTTSIQMDCYSKGGSTIIRVNSNISSNCEINIREINGRPIQQVFSGTLKHGINTFETDLSLPAGIYICTLSENDYKLSKRFLKME